MGSARFRCAVYAAFNVTMSASWSREHASKIPAVFISGFPGYCHSCEEEEHEAGALQ
jgi:hypothetical protein